MTRETQIGPRLEALLDERDHLRIKLHLASERPDPDAEAIDLLQRQIDRLETEISKHWKNPNA